MNRKQIRAKARELLGGGVFASQWLNAVLVMFVAELIISIICGGASIPAIVTACGDIANGVYHRDFADVQYTVSLMPLCGSIISLLVSGIISGALSAYSIALRRNKTASFTDAVTPVKSLAGDFFGLGLLQSLKIFLWALIPVVGWVIAIVKSYAFSQCFYVKLDNPDLTANECLAKSQQLMDGHKWNYFVLQLSFIGWNIVGAFAFGIGTFWVGAYTLMSNAVFYDGIKGGLLE